VLFMHKIIECASLADLLKYVCINIIFKQALLF